MVVSIRESSIARCRPNWDHSIIIVLCIHSGGKKVYYINYARSYGLHNVIPVLGIWSRNSSNNNWVNNWHNYILF